MPLLSRTRSVCSSARLILFIIVVWIVGDVCHAQGTSTGLIFNQVYGEAPQNGVNTYELATLAASTTSTADHLHLLITLNTGEGSLNNTSIDALFANRAGFAYIYTWRGAAPATGVKLTAYQNTDGSVNIYLVFNSVFGVASYSVLENIQETVYSSPTNLGSAVPPGTLIFDSSSPSYPPQSSLDFLGDLRINNNLGVGAAAVTPAAGGSQISLGPTGGYVWSGNSSEVISGPTTGSVYLAPVGVAGTRVSQSSGSLYIGGTGQTGATLNFPDGSSQSTAYLGGSGITQSNGGVALNGILQVTGAAPAGWSSTSQGSYLAWNQLTSSTGETDFINNEGGGPGGFAFFNTPPSGTPKSLLMFLAGAGHLGIGTSAPASLLHVADTAGISATATTNSNFGSANAVIQSAYGARSIGTGAALSFALPANTDGTNIWEQARLVATPDSTATLNAQGRLYLQTRYLTPSNVWGWNNNILLTSDGNTTFGGSVKLTTGNGSSITFQDSSVQSTAWTGVLQGGDYAESVDVTGNRAEYEPGDVLVVDPNAEGRFTKSSQAYSTAVMGIYSTRPGVVGRRQKSDRSHMAEEVPMAMIGVVPTKVSAEGGPIKPGDLLVTSSTPGLAMKATDHSKMMGAIIGKALGHLDSGTGLIEVAVSLQ